MFESHWDVYISLNGRTALKLIINSYFFSGRKRRGSETLSDSSGDEYYGMNGIISTTTQLSYWNHQSPSSRQQLNSTPILDPSSQNDQSNNGIGDGCRSGPPVMSECTAALVLMNLSHSPASNTHLRNGVGDVTYKVKKRGGAGSRSSSLNNVPPSTQLYFANLESSHIEDSQSKQYTTHQNQKQGHVGHVRCLPGGACLVGSELTSTSSSRLPEEQVQGTLNLFPVACMVRSLKTAF